MEIVIIEVINAKAVPNGIPFPVKASITGITLTELAVLIPTATVNL